MSQIRIVISLVVLFILLVPSIAFAQDETTGDFVNKVDLGGQGILGQSAEVNWSQGQMSVRGAGTAGGELTLAQAKLRARGAARADALRLLATTINGIRITAETTVREYALESDVVRTELQAFLRGASFPEEGESIEQLSDGSFIVYATAVLPLYGDSSSLAGVVLPMFQEDQQQGGSSQRQPSLLTHTYAQAIGPASGDYTGVVIDTSDLGLAPALAPEILSESGELIYSLPNLSQAALSSIGSAAYFTTVEAAQNSSRVGDNPLIIKAVAVTSAGGGEDSVCAVISDEDAARLRGENEVTGFLQEGGVSFAGRGSGSFQGEVLPSQFVSR